MKSFYFIRHGETDWNRSHKFMGHSDIPLNARGEQQAYEAIPFLISRNINFIISSPLLRATQTARILAKQLNQTVETDDSLKECCWGDMEGVIQKDGSAPMLSNWSKGQTPLGGESECDFLDRVQKGMKSILENYDNPLIVAHGGVFYALMKSLGYGEQDALNCVPYHFRAPPFEGLPWQVVALNDLSP